MARMLHPDCELEFPGSSFPNRVQGRDAIIGLFLGVRAGHRPCVGQRAGRPALHLRAGRGGGAAARRHALNALTPPSMTRPTLLITGATDNVGVALLPLLESHDAQLLAGSTRGEPVAGVPGRVIDFRSPEPLTRAFAGVDLAFVVIPLHPAMVEMAAHVAQAARAAGVKHLVRVSGAGADPDSPFAIGRVQGQMDQHLLASGSPTTLLGPKNFMQSFSSFLAGMIKGGSFYTSQGEGRIPFTDVRDVAAVAAEPVTVVFTHCAKGVAPGATDN
jgi:hypothetical protein